MITQLETPCRVYRGTITAGYGKHRNQEYMHRWVWSLINGPIPPSVRILHRCDNPPCFRYDHLFAGTQTDNMRDAIAKGRFNVQHGPSHSNAKLTLDIIDEMKTMRAQGLSYPAIARHYNVHPGTVRMAVLGKSYQPTIQHKEQPT